MRFAICLSSSPAPLRYAGGAIVKGGLYLEQLGHVDTVVLDKTGTLTFGQPEMRALRPVEGVVPMSLLEARCGSRTSLRASAREDHCRVRAGIESRYC